MELKDWIFVGLGLIQAAYAAAMYHRDRLAAMGPAKQPRRPIFIIGSFMLLTWAAIAFDVYDRHFMTMPKFQANLTYGHSPPATYFMNVHNPRGLDKFKSGYKLMLVVRAHFADVDRMSDTYIEKSTLYTITDEDFAVALTGAGRIRLAALAPNLIEYNLIVLPSTLSPDNIRSLGDVERLGGKILAAPAQGGVIGGEPQATQPSSK